MIDAVLPAKAQQAFAGRWIDSSLPAAEIAGVPLAFDDRWQTLRRAGVTSKDD
jgi:hypothetical protein